ncbi:hypothetical protein Tco_0087381 [Tanacetum coccineum]
MNESSNARTRGRARMTLVEASKIEKAEGSGARGKLTELNQEQRVMMTFYSLRVSPRTVSHAISHVFPSSMAAVKLASLSGFWMAVLPSMTLYVDVDLAIGNCNMIVLDNGCDPTVARWDEGVSWNAAQWDLWPVFHNSTIPFTHHSGLEINLLGSDQRLWGGHTLIIREHTRRTRVTILFGLYSLVVVVRPTPQVSDGTSLTVSDSEETTLPCMSSHA